MILDIYLTLLIMSLVFITLGLYANNPVLSIVGCGLLFLTGSVLMLDSVEYKTGMTITESGTTTNVDYTYDTYTNRAIGLIIMLVGFAGIFLTFLDMWRNKE